MPGSNIFDLGDQFGVNSPFGDWLSESREARAAEAKRRLAMTTNATKSKYKVILMGGADFYNEGAYGSNETLGEYVEKIALSSKYNIPLKKGDIQLVNSPLFGMDPTGKDIYDEILAIVQDGFDVQNGILILYGYSWGAQLQMSFLEFFKAAEVNIDLLLTIDAAKGFAGFSAENEVTSNVNYNLNIYQTQMSSIGSRGRPHKGTNVTNVDLTGVKNSKGEEIVHSNIDEYTLLYCAQVIIYALQGIYSFANFSEEEIREQIKIYASQGF